MQKIFHLVLVAVLSASTVVALPRASAVSAPTSGTSTSMAEPWKTQSYTGPDRDQVHQQNAAGTTCKGYLDPAVQDAHKTYPECQTYCAGKTDSQANNISTAVCDTSTTGTPEVYTDENGKYNMGKCECNNAIVDAFSDSIIQSLPAIGDIGCEVIFQAFTLVASGAAEAIPGDAEVQAAASGIKGLTEAAQTLAKAGKKAPDLLSWLSPCGESQYTSQVDAVFGDLTLGQVGGGGTGNLTADAQPQDPTSAIDLTPEKTGASSATGASKTSTGASLTVTGASTKATGASATVNGASATATGASKTTGAGSSKTIASTEATSNKAAQATKGASTTGKTTTAASTTAKGNKSSTTASPSGTPTNALEVLQAARKGYSTSTSSSTTTKPTSKVRRSMTLSA